MYFISQYRFGHFCSIYDPLYKAPKFRRLNQSELRPVTRGTANNFLILRRYPDTFAYSAICEWNELPSKIKDINGEKAYKDTLKKYLLDEAEKKYNNQYIYN